MLAGIGISEQTGIFRFNDTKPMCAVNDADWNKRTVKVSHNRGLRLLHSGKTEGIEAPGIDRL
jgi:hypothetical protein